MGIACPGDATARVYAVDPARTQVEFSVDATGFAGTTGTLRVLRGKLDLDPDHPEQARITLALDSASIDTGFAARDEAMRGGSFLDAARFPEITFTTTAVYRGRGDQAMVLGQLGLIGVSKAVTIDTRLEQAPVADDPVRFSGMTRLSRSDWGMTAFLPLVGDEVQIVFQLTAVPSP